MKKITIVHIIDSLGQGGAETLLVNLLKDLDQLYNIILVTLEPKNEFAPEEIVCGRFYCLNYRGIVSLPSCIRKLKKIIKEHKPSLVRSQLFLSTVIARIATPSGTPLVFSIHNTLSRDSYSKNRLALPVEKLTYKKRHHLISVSEDALNDFNTYVGIKGSTYILYNFINPVYFEKGRIRNHFDFTDIRMVAIGNLREQKNYTYLVDAFKELKDLPITLDIYGEGALREDLQQEIDKHQLRIHLQGRRKDVFNILDRYHVYVMCSLYEGFGIAPIEAMATGLPLLLSDLQVLREVTHNHALFFDPRKPETFVELSKKIVQGNFDLSDLSAKGIQIARDNYQKSDYINKLVAIYNNVLHVNA